jgi:hypothetical protein
MPRRTVSVLNCPCTAEPKFQECWQISLAVWMRADLMCSKPLAVICRRQFAASVKARNLGTLVAPCIDNLYCNYYSEHQLPLTYNQSCCLYL